MLQVGVKECIGEECRMYVTMRWEGKASRMGRGDRRLHGDEPRGTSEHLLLYGVC